MADLLAAGLDYRAIASTLGVGYSHVYRLAVRVRDKQWLAEELMRREQRGQRS